MSTSLHKDLSYGITAENVAKIAELPREMQDEQRPIHSVKRLKVSPVLLQPKSSVNVVTRKKTFVFSQDEFPKADSTTEALGALRPAFDKAGTVTAGNASGINDGAAALVIMEESAALAAGLTPWLALKVMPAVACPALMGMGPVPATQKTLQLAGLQLADIDLIEANEAFAAQFLAVGKTLGFDSEKVNVNGGAIAPGIYRCQWCSYSGHTITCHAGTR